MSRFRPLLAVFCLLLAAAACSRPSGANLQFEEQGRDVPEFDGEQAYHWVEQQLAFGPRVPGTPEHVSTMEFLRDRLRDQAGRQAVFVQRFEQEVYGEQLTMFNVLASFGLQHTDRIVLAAHWDTRPRAERDPERPQDPLMGADDGGSGVAVLLELARIFAENPPPIGVDLILFDGEDYGEESDLDHYFLGARHWGANPPVPGYSPRFGILLDMVGGRDAIFSKEGYSMQFAPNLVNEIWEIAAEKGHGNLFQDRRGGLVADDHMIVQRTTGIPMINIIHHTRRPDGSVEFAPWWHTHDDDIDIIDAATLQAVGDVLLELIYNRIPVSQ
ncbi:MAG: M28 family peptidase [Balneolaceae bacterium]